jgi:hypothetical protein
MKAFGAIDMSETNLDAKRDADLVNFTEYLDSLNKVPEITVAADADLKIYNSLCSRLKPGSRNK